MKYMATVTLSPHSVKDQETVNAFIPSEESHLCVLLKNGIFEQVYISDDYHRVWGIMEADSKERAQEELQSCALFPYMQVDLATLSAVPST